MKVASKNIFLAVLLLSAMSCENNSRMTRSVSALETSSDSLTTIVAKEEKIGIRMEKTGGVYTLPAKVNGVEMRFIFDTGASDVCISLLEAAFLAKNGYLRDDDIKGSSYTQLANGDIEKNTEIRLREVEIAGLLIKDVSALVSNNLNAPLLLGQSAIQKLGNIEIKNDSLFILRKVSKPTLSNDYQEEAIKDVAKAKIKKSRKAKTEYIEDKIKEANKLIDENQSALARPVLIEAQNLCGYGIVSCGFNRSDDEKKKFKRILKSNTGKYQWELSLLYGLTKYGSGSRDEYEYEYYLAAYYLNPNKENGVCRKYEEILTNLCRVIARGNHSYGLDSVWAKFFSEALQYCEDKSLIYFYMTNVALDYSISEASAYAQKAIDADPYSVFGYDATGLVYKHLGQTIEAVEYLEKALEINPKDRWTIRVIGNCYDDIGNRYTAREYWAKAAELGDDIAAKLLQTR